MNKVELQERFARMWRRSREDSGKSQEYVAQKLGVSKRTVQNWESGMSSPTQEMAFEWFEVLGLQPLPYYLDLLYGKEEYVKPTDSDKEIEEALIKRIKASSPFEQRKLLFMLNADHGSSASGILEMITAHLHVPLKDRLNIAQSIILNYEIAQAQGKLICSKNILPNIELLKMSFENGKKAVINNLEKYTNTNCEKG